MAAVLTIDGVTHEYRRRGVVRRALEDISLEVEDRQTLAVVGESGAGKSTLGRLVAGLERPTHGSIVMEGGTPLLRSGRPAAAQMVFQHPTEALNPLLPVGTSVAEPLRRLGRSERRRRVPDLLEQVGIDPSRSRDRPAAFSGGQLQRIVIARALAGRPRVLVCDEPTSALDVSVQAQIMNLLLDVQREMGFAMVLVTHDLAVAKVLSDRVAVLKDGHLMEERDSQEFFLEPAADYSRALLAAAREQMLA